MQSFHVAMAQMVCAMIGVLVGVPTVLEIEGKRPSLKVMAVLAFCVFLILPGFFRLVSLAWMG